MDVVTLFTQKMDVVTLLIQRYPSFPQIMLKVRALFRYFCNKHLSSSMETRDRALKDTPGVPY